MISTWSLFYAISASHGLFLSIILFLQNRGNIKANRILSVLVLLLTLYLTDILFGMLGIFESYPHLLHIATPLWYLFPPLLYFYFIYQTSPKVNLRLKDILHLVPYFVVLSIYIPFYLLSTEAKLGYAAGTTIPPWPKIFFISYILLSPVQIIVYSSIIVYLIYKDKTAGNVYPAHVAWLNVMAMLLLVFGIVQGGLITNWVITGNILFQFKFLPLALFSIIIFCVAYLAIIQPEFIFPQIKVTKTKYNESSLQETVEKLNQIMKTKKLYLNSELKYSELASELGISARKLTDVLKHGIGLSFNDFVNTYRVEEVKERIKGEEIKNMTLLAISLDSGFNNKTSFNRIFKKHTGQTPSEYITTTLQNL